LCRSLKAMIPSGPRTLPMRSEESSALTRAGWSPDGTMLAMVRAAPGNVEYSIINSANGSLITDLSTSGFSSHPFFDWAPDLGAETQPGTDVQIELGGVDLTFTGVTTSGTTTVTRIPPSSAGTVPNGFVLGGLAYEITTTAAYTAPVSVCFNVPSQYAPTQTAFNQLNLMHNEGGVLVNRTTSRDFPARTICGSVTTLSPFGLAEEINPALPSISGYVEDSDGVPMADVSVQLTGAENRVAQTDINGVFTFVNLIDGESYTVQPKSLGYLFSEYSADLFEITNENSLVFTGTQASFQISGRVTNGGGQGIGGVEVVLEGAAFKETLTDSNGDYVLTDLPAEGTYTVQVIAPGFSANPNQFEVAPLAGSVSSVDFMLLAPTAAASSISGRVVDRHGRGIRGAKITVQKGDGSREVAVTNTFGHYRINGLPAGETYVLQVSARRHSFTNAVQVVSLQADIAGMDFIASGP